MKKIYLVLTMLLFGLSVVAVAEAGRCPHNNVEETSGGDYYIPVNSEYHYHDYETRIWCDDCDVTLDIVYVWAEELEHHEFGDSNMCMWCGYQKDGSHSYENLQAEAQQRISEDPKSIIGKTAIIMHNGNPRAGAGLNFADIGAVITDDEYEIVGYEVAADGAVWLEIKFGNGTAWISASLAKISGANALAAEEAALYVGQICTIKVSSGRARAAADKNSPVLEYVGRGDRYTIIGCDAAPDGTLWFKIKVNNVECWVSSGLTEVKKAERPVNQQPAKKETAEKEINVLIADMVNSHDHLINDLETTTYQYKNNGMWQAGGAMVSNTMTMGGTTIDNIFEDEEQDLLQGALIEMLYGESGFSTEQKINMIASAVNAVDQVKTDIDAVKDIRAGIEQEMEVYHLSKTVKQNMNTVDEMRYTILNHKNLITPSGELTAAAANSADYAFYTRPLSSWSYDDFAKMRNDYLVVKNGSGPKITYGYATNGELTKVGFDAYANKSLDSFDLYVYSKTQVDLHKEHNPGQADIGTGVDVALSILGYIIEINENAAEAEEALPKCQAILENEINNAAILTVLYENSEGETKKACKQLLKDLSKEFEGWASSPAKRRQLYENGKATIEFSCDVGVTIAAVGNGVASKVSAATAGFGIGALLSDLAYNGEPTQITNEVEYFDTTEKLMEVKKEVYNALMAAPNDTAEQYYLSELYSTLLKQEAALAVGYHINKAYLLDDYFDWRPEKSEYVVNAMMNNSLYHIQESQNEVREYFIQNTDSAVKAPINPYVYTESLGALSIEIEEAYEEYRELSLKHYNDVEMWKMLKEDGSYTGDKMVVPSKDALNNKEVEMAKLEKQIEQYTKRINELKEMYCGFRQVNQMTTEDVLDN